MSNTNGSIQQQPILPVRLSPIQVAISAFQNIAEEAKSAVAALSGTLPIDPLPPIHPLVVTDPSSAPAPQSLDPSSTPAPQSSDGSAVSAGLIALSDEIGKRLPTDPTLQALIQNLAGNAVVEQAKATSVLPFMMKQGNPGSTTGLSAGGGATGGSSLSGAKPLPPTIPAPTVSYFWWGFQVKLSSEAVRWYVGGENTAAGLSGVAGAVYPITDAAVALVAAGGSTGPGVVFFAVLAAYLVAEASLIQAADKGKGVYLSMSWFAPAVFVPTSV